MRFPLFLLSDSEELFACLPADCLRGYFFQGVAGFDGEVHVTFWIVVHDNMIVSNYRDCLCMSMVVSTASAGQKANIIDT
jgi:hypothetical protein